MPEQQPFARTMWRTCDGGQLTTGGLRDASRHSKVREYTLSSPHSQRKACVCLGPVGTLSLSPWPRREGATAIRGGVRPSTEDHTMQVVGAIWAQWARGLGRGQFSRNRRPCVPSHYVGRELMTPADCLEYACPVADAASNALEKVPAWTDHLGENAPLNARLDAVFGTAGLDAWASWCVGLPQSPMHPLCLTFISR